MMRDRPMSASGHRRVYGLGPVRFARASADRGLPRYASDTDLPNFSGAAQCAEASPLAFCERFRGCQLGNPPVSEAIVFGVGLGIMAIGEQADNLEAIRRTAAYQDRPRHGPFVSFCMTQRRVGHAALAAISAAGSISMPDFGFGRCDGHHEMVDLGLRTKHTIACHLPKPRPRVHGIISVRNDRELGLPLE
jgi:hypothetical protein